MKSWNIMKTCQIEREERDALDILHIDGALDANSFDRLENVLKALRADNRNRVIIDCGNLTYISSVNLGALINFAQQLREEGGRLALSNLSPQIMKIVKQLGFDMLLKCYPDLDDAETALSAD